MEVVEALDPDVAVELVDGVAGCSDEVFELFGDGFADVVPELLGVAESGFEGGDGLGGGSAVSAAGGG